METPRTKRNVLKELGIWRAKWGGEKQSQVTLGEISELPESKVLSRALSFKKRKTPTMVHLNWIRPDAAEDAMDIRVTRICAGEKESDWVVEGTWPAIRRQVQARFNSARETGTVCLA